MCCIAEPMKCTFYRIYMTKGKDSISLTRLKEETERVSYVICNIIKIMSIKYFFMNSDVLTEQHRLQTRIRTGKCNFFNLKPKLLSLNIGYDSTVTFQTKQMHLPHQAGRFAGRRSSLQRWLPFVSLSFYTAHV